ncbi:MAG: hypothetical protein FD180_2573 [Planctomycetota bacterium]|nr:MAG: hypothetical protein FD180_2573 [Planctomycetota bacterium]
MAGFFTAALAICASQFAAAQTLPPPDPSDPSDESSELMPKDALRRFGTLRFRLISPAIELGLGQGGFLLARSADYSVALVKWPSGWLRNRIEAGSRALLAAVALPSGKQVVVSYADKRVQFLNTPAFKWDPTWTCAGYVTTALAIDPKELQVACAGDDGKIHIRRLGSGEETRVLRAGDEALRDVQWRGEKIASLGRSGLVCIWGRDDSPPLQVKTNSSTRHIFLSHDGLRIFAVGGSRDVAVWSTEKGELETRLQMDPEECLSAAISPDGSTLAAGGRAGTVRVVDMKTQKEIFRRPAHVGWVVGILFSPDGKSVISCGEDRRLRVWDSISGADLAVDEGHRDAVSCLALSPDGKVLASGGWDRCVVLWDRASATALGRAEGLPGPVEAISWTGDGAALAVTSGRSAFILSAKDLAIQQTFTPDAGNLRAVASLEGGGVVVGGTDTTARLLNSGTGGTVQVFSGHAAMIRGLAAIPKKGEFLSAGGDGRVGRWKSAGGDPTWLEAKLGPASCVACSPDGKRFAAGFDGRLQVWNTETGAPERMIHSFFGEISSIAFSPDGGRIATTTLNGAVRVCDTTTGVETARFEAGGGPARGICWAPDSSEIYSGLYDTTILAWKIK